MPKTFQGQFRQLHLFLRAAIRKVTRDFQIRPFVANDQAAVEKLVLNIQQVEFGLELSANNQADIRDVVSYFAGDGSAFWVASTNDTHQLIGCIGLEMIEGQVSVMRKFMVAQNWRGSSFGVASALHKAFLDHALLHCSKIIALSTVSVTQAAQSFYRRSGYRTWPKEQMPAGFVAGPLDVIYMIGEVQRLVNQMSA
jgi:N-acetylglutamate synthase-like GNAT family acetyltransferase